MIDYDREFHVDSEKYIQQFIKDIQLFDHEYFFRMTSTNYEHLLSLIAPAITKSSLRRETIGASERLMVTLRYIYGDTSQRDLAGMLPPLLYGLFCCLKNLLAIQKAKMNGDL